jgi:arsenate reductase (thioredoxin)
MPERPLNVLFLCTGNSARSIIAEVLLNDMGRARFRAYSAGSQPKGTVHPQAIRLLNGLGYDTTALRSKSWDEFAEAGAPVLNFIFTVCDSAAAETCPVWPGYPTSAHWGVPDPAAVQGTDAQIAAAFNDTARMLRQRISIFTALPFAQLDEMSLRSRLIEIGRMDAASADVQS